MTAVHPVGDGQCIALGYESVLPLVLLTLQGGDMKPYEFPTEGATVMAGTGANNDRSSSTCSVIGFSFQLQNLFCFPHCGGNVALQASQAFVENFLNDQDFLILHDGRSLDFCKRVFLV